MAVWQAKLHAVLPSPIPGVWRNWPGLPSLRAALDALFGPEESEFSPEMLHWGPYDRHDARLWLDSDEKDDDEEDDELLLRLDLRDLDPNFVRSLASLLANAGLRLRLEDGSFVEATESHLLRLIRESNAARFMQDPQGYLDALFNETSPRTDDLGLRGRHA